MNCSTRRLSVEENTPRRRDTAYRSVHTLLKKLVMRRAARTCQDESESDGKNKNDGEVGIMQHRRDNAACRGRRRGGQGISAAARRRWPLAAAAHSGQPSKPGTSNRGPRRRPKINSSCLGRLLFFRVWSMPFHRSFHDAIHSFPVSFLVPAHLRSSPNPQAERGQVMGASLLSDAYSPPWFVALVDELVVNLHQASHLPFLVLLERSINAADATELP
jgi:hypothetical protein